MTRVVSGTAGGLRLQAPSGGRTRPTSDRVKEALFSSLGDVTGCRVLDLYAGSGGLGIEALSRGARSAVFVDSDRRALTTIRRNLAHTRLADRARVVGALASRFCALPTGGPFDLVLLDPPYVIDLEQIAADLRVLAGADGLLPGARVVVERDARRVEEPPHLLSHLRDRSYGDTMLRYFTYDAPGQEPQ